MDTLKENMRKNIRRPRREQRYGEPLHQSIRGDFLYLEDPPELPGDCSDEVKRFVSENFRAYDGDESFLAGPTERTLKALKKFADLLEKERKNGGVLDVDTEVVSTITSHKPGYILSPEEDLIKGLQTDMPLKRSCKPMGGFRTVEKALNSYGYEASPKMKEMYTEHVKTHNDFVFSMYTEDMRKARHAHLLTGLPDSYGRGRIIADYRRIALFGVDELIRRKKLDFDAIIGSSEEELRLRSEIHSQIQALQDLLVMADTYEVNLRKPARSFHEAVQFLWLGHTAALKEQDGAAMSIGRWDAFLDIYAENDLKEGIITETEAQEIIDDLVLKIRAVRHLRTPDYNSLFSGDPTWVTLALGGCIMKKDEYNRAQKKSMVTKTSFRFLHTLTNLGASPEPNLTVLWSDGNPPTFLQYCAKLSVATSSIQYENDDLMRPIFGFDYGIACCVSAMRSGIDMQFFGARANLVKLLLMCLNGGRDEIEGIMLCSDLHNACKSSGILETDENHPINYEILSKLFFDVAMPSLAKLYADTMNCIHYSHDYTEYENLQMALHNSNVHRFMAFGIAGLSAVVDSLATIKQKKVYPIRNDDGITIAFKQDEPGKVINYYGNDCDEIDDIATKICAKFQQELSKQKLYRNSRATLSILTITANCVYGKSTGASPDGRERGDPFAPGANAMHNRDVHGVLASLSSVAKLPYKNCLDGISNTFCITPSALAKDGNQAGNLVSLLNCYFKRGGHHININCLGRSMLEEAHEHPDRYPNLTIRVSGYAVRFNQLTKEQREEVLKRTMYSTHTSKKTKVNYFTEEKGVEICESSNDSGCIDIEDICPREVDAKSLGQNNLGVVQSIETFTTADGPGVRVIVFMQGCPKRCLFCCNPETQKIVNSRYSDASMTDHQVATIIEKYSDFLAPNKGGITISGGEALLQSNFVTSVFERVHALGLTTCIDTAGHGSEEVWKKVLKETDYILLCLKAMDPDLSGFVNGTNTSRAGYRAKQFAIFAKNNFPHIQIVLRWVLLRGLTDTDAEIKELITFAKTLQPCLCHIELLPYHDFAREKYDALKMNYPLEGMDPYKQEDAERIKQVIEDQGIKVLLAEDE